MAYCWSEIVSYIHNYAKQFINLFKSFREKCNNDYVLEIL